MRTHDRHHHRHRRGAVMAEVAILLPALFLFLMGTITIGQGIFFYQQVAELAQSHVALGQKLCERI